MRGLTTKSVIRTSDVLFPRQLVPTVGPAHGGVEFLEGSSSGIEKLMTDRLKKNRQKNIYIIVKFIGPDRKSVNDSMHGNKGRFFLR